MGRKHRRRHLPPQSRRQTEPTHARLRQARHHARDDGQHQHAVEQPGPAVLAARDGGPDARVHQVGRVDPPHPLEERAPQADDARGQVPGDVPLSKGARPRRDNPDLHGWARAAGELRGRRRRRLAHGPVEFTPGDGLLHAWVREPGPHRLPERREAHEGHGREVHVSQDQAAGRSLRHQHDLERLQPRGPRVTRTTHRVWVRYGRAERAGVQPPPAGPLDVDAPTGRHVDVGGRGQVRDAHGVRGDRVRRPRPRRARGHEQAPGRPRRDELRARGARRPDGQGHGPRDRDAGGGARDFIDGPGAHHENRQAARPERTVVIAGVQHVSLRKHGGDSGDPRAQAEAGASRLPGGSINGREC
mmetsp:Transcript_13493/g.41654  ORF Transcript_13493/g.41654 Transcript_13493/m.41654 type:complete len:360 (+) Transcript_13493:1481-2560(+)